MDYIFGLVSVVIPTYKRSEMLVRAIESVLNQTYKNIELIVVNDNVPNDVFSIDLYEKLKKIKDDRLVFVEQEKHINGAAARNCGIKNAQGEYIAFLDDDDYWALDKIENQLALLKNLPPFYGGVSCLVKQIKNGQLISASVPYSTKNLMERVLSRRTRIGTGAVLFRRVALDNSGYFDEQLKRHQEIQLFAYFASKYKIKLLKEYLYIVDVSDNQNRPAVSQIHEIKNDFYKSVEPLLNTFSKKEKTKIVLMHEGEIAYTYLKSHQYKNFFKCFAKMVIYPSTVFCTFKIFANRFIGKHCKNILIKLYR